MTIQPQPCDDVDYKTPLHALPANQQSTRVAAVVVLVTTLHRTFPVVLGVYSLTLTLALYHSTTQKRRKENHFPITIHRSRRRNEWPLGANMLPEFLSHAFCHLRRVDVFPHEVRPAI